MGKKQTEGQYSEQEAARRRDTVLLRMLKTPPKPHDRMKGGNKARVSAKSKRACATR